MGLLCVATLTPARAATADGALWSLWQRHLAVTNHAAMAAACADFATEPRHGALAPVAYVFAGWHLLRGGHLTNAVEVLTALAARGDTPVRQGCAEIARTWLTRVDAAVLKDALHRHYLRAVAFPKKLTDLRTEGRQDAIRYKDRWGRDWTYRLVGFQSLPGLRNQKYSLRSPVLGDDTALAPALARPYAATIDLRPVRHVSGGAGHATWEFDGPAAESRKVLLTVGAASGDTRFLYAGEAVLVLANREYCNVYLRPRE